MNVATILQQRVQTIPNSVAIVDYQRGRARELTFDELDRSAAQFAALLQQTGLRRGDTVLVLVPMSAELYLVLAAIFRLGLIALFLDPSAPSKQLEATLRDKLPQAMVGGLAAQALRWFKPLLRRIPHSFSLPPGVPGTIPLTSAARLAPLDNIVACEDSTPALITFTSGTGSEPKAALRTHGFLHAQLRALSQCIDYLPGEIDLATLPVFVLANLAMGLTSLIPDVNLRRPGQVKPGRLVELIAHHGVTQLGGSPTLLAKLAEYCQREQRQLNTIKRIHTGGGAVLPGLLQQLRRCAPEAEITAVYGSTEAEPIACLNAEAIQAADLEAMSTGGGLLVGATVDSLQLRVLPDRWGGPIGPFSAADFAQTCLPAGKPGELVVSGEHVLPGYLNPADDRMTKFDVGAMRWHRTGDAGYLDEHGRLWLLGRCSAAIEVAGQAIYPFAVELVARQHPEVRNAALVLVQGQRTLALEPRRQRTTPDQFAGLLEQLSFAGIEQVRIVRKIPVDRRHHAKVDYPALRALLEGSK